jgi:glycosyltransferase involved in cell wall biosynthesis
MKRILFSAPLLPISGYSVAARQIFKWLLKKEQEGKCKLTCDLLSWGDCTWIIDRNRYDGLIGEIMARSEPPQGQYDVSMQLKLPNEFNPKMANYNVGMSACVETDKCHPSWVEHCNAMDMMIVPSAHIENTLRNSGNLRVETHVIPEAYPECFQTASPVDLKLELPNAFNVLVFGQLTGNNPENDRKNIFYTIKWLCEAFKDEDVGIVLKTNVCRNTKIDKRLLHNTIANLVKSVRRGNTPNIYVLHGDMSDVEVLSLYKHPKINALVSLTRGEGFGLPILEAAACGLPVVATNWSAHTEFLNHGKYITVGHQLVDIHDTRVDGKIFIKGSKWAQPSEDEFKRKIRKFRSNGSIPKQWAKELSTIILEKYSQEAIEKYYDEKLGSKIW